MIPYDDLVAALSAWRARQGLPISTMGGAAPTAAPPHDSGPARTSPPMAPPRPGADRSPPAGMRAAPPGPPPRGHAPPPLEAAEELDVEDAALIDESHYENEGGDFAMKFSDDEGSTAIGAPPAPVPAPAPPAPAKPAGKKKRNEEW